jgi:hypothetical protein
METHMVSGRAGAKGGGRLELPGALGVRYFAPVAFCGYLGLLCLGTVATAAFLADRREAAAMAATGVFGLLLSVGLGAAILAVQLRELRYLVVPTAGLAQEHFLRVQDLAEQLGWHVTRAVAGQLLEARTPDAMLEQGEIVAVKFRAHEVLVASICDPEVGFSLLGRSRCRRNRELVRSVVLGLSRADSEPVTKMSSFGR